MREKQLKLSLTGAIVILSICILLSASIISSAIRDSSMNNAGYESYKYEIERFNENFGEIVKILQEKNNEW